MIIFMNIVIGVLYAINYSIKTANNINFKIDPYKIRTLVIYEIICIIFYFIEDKKYKEILKILKNTLNLYITTFWISRIIKIYYNFNIPMYKLDINIFIYSTVISVILWVYEDNWKNHFNGYIFNMLIVLFILCIINGIFDKFYGIVDVLDLSNHSTSNYIKSGKIIESKAYIADLIADEEYFNELGELNHVKTPIYIVDTVRCSNLVLKNVQAIKLKEGCVIAIKKKVFLSPEHKYTMLYQLNNIENRLYQTIQIYTTHHIPLMMFIILIMLFYNLIGKYNRDVIRNIILTTVLSIVACCLVKEFVKDIIGMVDYIEFYEDSLVKIFRYKSVFIEYIMKNRRYISY